MSLGVKTLHSCFLVGVGSIIADGNPVTDTSWHTLATTLLGAFVGIVGAALISYYKQQGVEDRLWKLSLKIQRLETLEQTHHKRRNHNGDQSEFRNEEPDDET